MKKANEKLADRLRPRYDNDIEIKFRRLITMQAPLLLTRVDL